MEPGIGPGHHRIGNRPLDTLGSGVGVEFLRPRGPFGRREDRAGAVVAQTGQCV